MLYRSGDNLEKGAINFIEANNEVTLLSAYIKLEQLKKINTVKKINRIIVRWEIQDLCLGVSDGEKLFTYCKANNIILLRNTRIHLKVLWNNKRSIFFGSSNITGRGVGEKGKFNYELNGTLNNININDLTYFKSIINGSELVNDELFLEIMELVDSVNMPSIKYPVKETVKKQSDYFLLSNLPMTETVEQLYEGYINAIDLKSDEMNYFSHDIALYNIPEGLGKIEFSNYIKNTFNNHPFIKKLKDHIKNSSRQSLNYGSVVRWIQDNTTTVPTPRAWEIKKEIIVNILYSWICFLDEDFTWDTPNYSQIIYYHGK